jgi:hypothetical protein
MIKVVSGELENVSNVLSECPSPGTLVKREDCLLTKSMDCLPSQRAGPPFPSPV